MLFRQNRIVFTERFFRRESVKKNSVLNDDTPVSDIFY